MKIKILAVGSKMPAWVSDGVKEYFKRFPREIKVEIVEIPLGNRAKNADTQRAVKQECDQLLSYVDKADHVIALEVKGRDWSTEKLAENMKNWQMNGLNVTLLVGGPDGLNEDCRRRANQQWSLSALTLPHPIVRVILAEQLYRAWTVTQNHPYHRA